MSQRLPIHPTISDPSTGEPLRALTVIGNMPVWPQMGSQDETEGGSTEGSTEGTESTQSEGESEATETEGTESTEGQESTVSREEFERIKTRMQAADRRASAAETKVKEFEDAGKSELEKAQADAKKAAEERDAERQLLNDLRVENAFLAANDVTWHDPTDALKMLRSDFMDGVEIGEDGKVTGMKDAIKKMSKEKAYLVNSGSTSSTSSKDKMNGKRKGAGGEEATARDRELAARMPALQRRAPLT